MVKTVFVNETYHPILVAVIFGIKRSLIVVDTDTLWLLRQLLLLQRISCPITLILRQMNDGSNGKPVHLIVSNQLKSNAIRTVQLHTFI